MANGARSILPAGGRPLSYAMALVASGVALALSLLASRAVRPYAFSELFLAAIAFSAWYGGLAAGLVAAVVSVVMSIFVAVPPVLAGNPGSVAQGLLFVLAAFIGAGLRATMHAASARADAHARAVERQERRLAFL